MKQSIPACVTSTWICSKWVITRLMYAWIKQPWRYWFIYRFILPLKAPQGNKLKRTEELSKSLVKSELASLLQVPGTEKATYLGTPPYQSPDWGSQMAGLADRRTRFKQGNRSRLCWDTTEIPTTTRIRKQRQWPGPPNPSRSNQAPPKPTHPFQQIEAQGWVRGSGSLPPPRTATDRFWDDSDPKPRQRNLLAAKGETQYTVLCCWVAPSFCQKRPEPFRQEQWHPAWTSEPSETRTLGIGGRPIIKWDEKRAQPVDLQTTSVGGWEQMKHHCTSCTGRDTFNA